MGCDIHVHSELNINGQWHHLSELTLCRNYDLFCYMAGVRGGYRDSPEPISQPRGLPEDVSFITNIICNKFGNDGHSHSWLSSAETVKVGEFLEEQHKKSGSKDYFCAEKVLGYIFGNGWKQFTEYPEELPEGVEDGRLVFWFDN
jgi:hypothetical protein